MMKREMYRISLAIFAGALFLISCKKEKKDPDDKSLPVACILASDSTADINEKNRFQLPMQ